MNTMNVTRDEFLKIARRLNLNSPHDQLRVSDGQVKLHRDSGRFRDLSLLPDGVDKMHIDPPFPDHEAAMVWCARNLPGCSCDPDFMRYFDDEE